MANLVEGMRPNDLEGLVLPLLSIDEYQSEIDQDAVAVGFYVQDQQAAKDLNRFIQKSPTVLIGSAVSPAPDEQGYYIVFVEFLNNTRMVRELFELLAELEPLVAISKWNMHVRGIDGVRPLSREMLMRHFGHAGNMLEFFRQSLLAKTELKENRLNLSSNRNACSYEIIGFGDLVNIMQEHGLAGKPVSLDPIDLKECRNLQCKLGLNWEVARIDGFLILTNSNDRRAVLLR